MAGITKREQINRKIAAAVTKMTPEIIAKLKQAFAIDATIEEACSYAEIHTSTYHRWVIKHPELSDEFERLRQRPVLTARTTVVRGLASDTGLAMSYLVRKRPDEFVSKQKIEHEGKIQTEDVANEASVDEIKDIVKEAEDNIKKAIAKSHGKTL